VSAQFLLGRLVITQAAQSTAETVFDGPEAALVSLADLISRHSSGDWGDVNASGRTQNNVALLSGGRLFSIYEVGSGVEFWIITDRYPNGKAVTTILLPTDY
jgi:hypothetical protein